MPLYHFKARDKDGRDVDGERDSKDQYELARSLRVDGLTPILIGEPSVAKKKNLDDYVPSFFKRVSLEEKMNFTRNTAVMIGAGLSLSKALDIMSRQASNEKFKKIILDMADTIRRGKTFADALGEYPKVFPKFYQEMVRSGEKSGKLEEALKLVSLQLKKDYALRKKIKGAMLYPAIIMAAMVVIGILMLIYVVPTLIQTFKELNIKLPASTRFIILVSESLLESGLILLGAAVFGGYVAWRWFKSKIGKITLDWILIRIPVIKGLNQKFNSARTCRTLSSLISSGVDILEALNITRGVLQNHLYQNILDDARTRIQKGESVSKSFLNEESSKLYPPLMGEMMAVGEETGELSQMMLRLAIFYESEVASATKNLSTIIEPVMMILIGAVVGFFAISMISPMYDLVNAF